MAALAPPTLNAALSRFAKGVCRVARHRRFKGVLGTLTLAGVVLAGPTATAADEVHCSGVHELTLSPGLSIQPSTGTFKDQFGRMECHGPINGRSSTGAGSYADSGRYGTRDPDTCQDGGEGDGVFTSVIPTNDGDVVLTASYTFTYGDFTSNPGYVSGQFSGDGVHGTFKIRPLEGDCITKAVTRAHEELDFYFAKSFPTR